MKICGLQKLTALDYPGKLACTIFTPGCDLRCGFCHNAALVTAGMLPELMPEDVFFAFLEKRRGLLDGICLTGGEPLLQPDIEPFLRKVKALGYLVKLDTNGCHPEELEALIAAGLVDYVAMDIKNAPEKYPETCGAQVDMVAVERSKNLLLSGRVDYEFRTTVVHPLHCLEDFEVMGEWIQGAGRWYLQQFVDSGGLISGGLQAHSRDFLLSAKLTAERYAQYVEIRGI